MSSIVSALLPNEDNEPQDTEMADLFGQDDEQDDDLSRASPSASANDSERLPSPERDRRRALEYEEEDLPPELAVEVKEAEVSFPNLPVPKSSDQNTWVIRMPNYVRVDTKPFHPDTYIGPEQEDEELQSSTLNEKTMSIKLRVENTLRWRWVKDEFGNDKRQSNSRFIRWSDGSMSLRLGKELFDVTQTVDTSGGSQRQSSQASSQSNLGKTQGLTYLVAQHKRSEVLQAEAVVTGYMTLRPTGMQSETHRLLVKAVGQKHNKIARLRMAPDPTIDPEREKLELMKLEAKKSKRKAKADRTPRNRSHRQRRSQNLDFSDDDDDIFDASEDDDDDIRMHTSGSKKKKPRLDDEGSGEYRRDDFLVDDDEDEDGGGGRKPNVMDDLDKLDAKIEQQDAKRKRRKDPNSDDDGDDDEPEAMDVESEEEDEEEFGIRSGAKPAGRKRQLYEEEDE